MDAFWAVEAGESVNALAGVNGHYAATKDGQLISALKQGPDDLDEFTRRIMAGINFVDWETALWAPAWESHTVRTLSATTDTVNLSLGLQVNIPDPIARDVVARGGIRRGLVDISQQTRNSIFQALSEGRALGEGPLELASRIRSMVPPGRFVHAGSRYRSLCL